MVKITKNKTDAKIKIIGLILVLRKEKDVDVYSLGQTRVLSMISNMGGGGHFFR